MKHIFLNLKRFDVQAELGGVNRTYPPRVWASELLSEIQNYKIDELKNVEFCVFLPEAHLISALGALKINGNIEIGCQGVSDIDTKIGVNFGAMTSLRSAHSMAQLGVSSVLIGHCEERKALKSILFRTGVDTSVEREIECSILNEEIKRAIEAGMKVVYCIGEAEDELPIWDRVLNEQLRIGLSDCALDHVVVAYEPIWSIGPGKKPADAEYIRKVASFVKQNVNDVDVVYGGGLKENNAKSLSAIQEIDGGLIALTRFSGEIGFYPNEFIEIVKLYLNEE